MMTLVVLNFNIIFNKILSILSKNSKMFPEPDCNFQSKYKVENGPLNAPGSFERLERIDTFFGDPHKSRVF